MTTNETLLKCDLLAKSLLFRQLQTDDLDKLARFSKFKLVKAKEVIFNKAEPGNQMAVIVKGRVKMSTLSEEGREMTFGVLEAGEIFGEISLLDGKQRSATITTLEPTELLVIDRRDFIPFLEQYPKVAIKLLSTLAQRLRLTNENFEDVLFRNLPARLAKRFLTLAENYGEQAETGTKITLKLSQQEIGNLVGTSRESVNKQMRAWEDEGILKFEKGYLTLLHSGKLEEFTENLF
jgi:CRP/FNR family cyclic AMP-dependent transcriptional regulator